MEPETFKKLAGSDDRLGPAEIRQGGGSRRAGKPQAAAAQGQGACRLAHHVVRHDRRTAPAGRSEAGGLDRQELPAGPAAGCRRGLHGQFPPEHPRGDDGQHRRRLLRDAGDPLSQRRHGSDGVQCPHGERAQGNRRRGRADRQGSGAGRAADGESGLSRPLGHVRRNGRAVGSDRVLQALR